MRYFKLGKKYIRRKTKSRKSTRALGRAKQTGGTQASQSAAAEHLEERKPQSESPMIFPSS